MPGRSLRDEGKTNPRTKSPQSLYNCHALFINLSVFHFTVRVTENMAPGDQKDSNHRRRASQLKKFAAFLLVVVTALIIALVVTSQRLKAQGENL